MQLKFLGLVLVLCFIHFTYVYGLKANDTGVCAVTRSVKKTQRRVYIVKYKCGRKICTTRRSKIKDYIVTQNDILCCTGWTYSSALDACSPLCSRGCIGGRCTAPDICTCEPPATLDQDNKNACYLPTCEPRCINGLCTANNTCTCSHGYENVDNTCQPKCDSCTNGQCVSPNNCECNEGYIKKNGVCSLPICQPPCINEICTVNNTCTCSRGYENVDNTCQPKCDSCANGQCISPNNCKCNEGYTKKNGLCSLPICQPPCINGICTLNNTCTCSRGYENVDNTCQPKCDNCENGNCTAPNNCDCLKGYGKSDGVCKPLCVNAVNLTSNMCKCVIGYKNDSDGCYKPCREDCVVCDLSGNCKPKNNCGSNEVVCCDGFYWDEVTMLCKPSCRPGCGINGVCIGINTCKCKSPYVWRESTCLPPITCDTPCVNGKCKDNTCTCDVGYVPKNATYCKPECRKSCINSYCVAPERCDCLQGYTRKNQWECVPNCEKCDNGECIGPNICKCNEGYFKQGDKCVPICEGNCLHGHCSRPGECTCDEGYANHATDKLTCRPVCEPGCLNATCVTPNHCLCSPGYIKTKNASVCKPKCDYCTNGDCVGPNICKCHDGYVMIGIKCKPVCSKTCVNGFCSEPDKCTCLPTYIKDVTDDFNCKPECADCENGKCSSPGRCACNAGYEKRNGKCEPICSEPCINGYCKSPNQCGCHDGYKMNYTMDSAVCYKPCLRPCDNGICNINGECVCTYGYSNDTGCLEKNNETIDCKSCKGNCTDDVCKCPNGRPCELLIEAQRTGLAGLELTWILGACIGGLLFIFVIAIMGQMWRKRPNAKTTYAEESRKGSVGFTAPGTLIFNDKKADEDRYSSFEKEYDDEENKNEQTTEGLLYGDVMYEDEEL